MNPYERAQILADMRKESYYSWVRTGAKILTGITVVLGFALVALARDNPVAALILCSTLVCSALVWQGVIGAVADIADCMVERRRREGEAQASAPTPFDPPFDRNALRQPGSQSDPASRSASAPPPPEPPSLDLRDLCKPPPKAGA